MLIIPYLFKMTRTRNIYLWIFGIQILIDTSESNPIVEGSQSYRSCSSNRFLTFTSASYYYNSCSWNAKNKLNSNCNYPTSCTIHASNTWLGHDPCVGNVKYLSWTETCTDIWTSWTSWSCPSSCTTQTLTRTRSCNRPSGCSGSSSQSSSCLSLGCPRHGEWGEWDTWNSCTVTCGGGTRVRSRECNNPSPLNGGNNCGYPGPYTSTETISCNTLDCFRCGNRDYVYSLSTTSSSDSTQRQIILLEDASFRISCCGVIKTWTFHARKSGEIKFQVWRKSGTTYTLVGQNSYSVPAGATGVTHTYQVPEFDRIITQSGDLIGWFCPSDPVVSYSSGSAVYPDNIRIGTLAAGLTVYEGDTYTWLSVAYTNDISYAIKVSTADSGSPYFVNMGLTVTVFDTTAVGSRVYTVSVWDPDRREDLIVTPTTSAAHLNYQSGYIVTESALSVGTYSLSLSVTDTCQNSAAATITVQVINTPPIITNLPDSCLIHEDTVNRLRLFTLSTSDRQSDVVTCELSSTSPSNAPFEVQQIQGTTDYGIFSLPNPNLSFDTVKQYKTVVSCSDVTGGATSGEFYVDIQKNTPPVIKNLPAEVTLNASSVHAGDVIFTVRTHDDENDTLTFTMSPNSAPFQILNYGDIQVTRDLSEVFQAGYDLSITVADVRTTIPARVLSIHLQNVNDVPVFGNLPVGATWNVLENTPLGVTLYKVDVNNLDTTDTIQYDVEYNPTTGSSYFTINETNGEITTSLTMLDYETVPSKQYQLIITATDGKDTSTATMSVSVADENEPCSFHQNQYSVSADEGSAGTLFSDAGFVIADEDAGSSHTFQLSCGVDSWRFSINSNSGRVSYFYSYDLDTEKISSYTCKVTATDTGSLSCTTSLVISISDINDNSPAFDSSEDPIYVTPYETAGIALVNVTATDADVSSYGDVIYRLDMSTYNFQYFDVTSYGTIFVNKDLTDFVAGETLDLTLSAIDFGGNQGTVKIRVVFYELNTTTTSTTEMPEKFITSSWNVVWLTCLVVLIATMATLSIFFFFTYTTPSMKGLLNTTAKRRMKRMDKKMKDTKTTNKSEKERKETSQINNQEITSLIESNHQESLRDVQSSPVPKGVFPRNYGEDLPIMSEHFDFWK